MNAPSRCLNPARAGVMFVSLLLLFACTEKTYITNPPPVIPDQRPPLVEWVSVTSADSSADLNRRYFTVSDTVTLTVSASDESGIDSVKLYINGFPRFVRVGRISESVDSVRVGRASESVDSVGFGDPTYAFTWNTISASDDDPILAICSICSICCPIISLWT